MHDVPEFVPFAKIARLSRPMIITEKIDGTNACVWWSDDMTEMRIASRSKWITYHTDNHGFARWALEHQEELERLGPGYHFGEWWGRGIQRNYGLDHKRFSLFNTSRWNDDTKPVCCHVVPTLYVGTFDTRQIHNEVLDLQISGSHAAPGFKEPEGVMVFHVAAGHYFKKTIVKDDEHKRSDA